MRYGLVSSPRCTTDSVKPTTSTRYRSAASASRKEKVGQAPGEVFCWVAAPVVVMAPILAGNDARVLEKCDLAR